MGLVARVLERAGFPTVMLSSAFDITARVKPPRSAFLDFPLGNAAGRPNEPEEQRTILRGALRMLEQACTPGSILELPYGWPDSHWVEKLVEQYEKEAEIVMRQRQEGEYERDARTGELVHYAAREAAEVAQLA